MDKSQVLKIMADNSRQMANLLGIEHWNIAFKCEHLCAGFTSNNYVNAGCCEINAAYNSAVITINHEAVETEEDVLYTLRHELMHIVVAPLEVYREFALCMVEENQEQQENKLYHYALEQLVQSIERLYHNMEESHAEVCCS